VRAFNPWPGAFTTWQNQLLKISRAHVAPASAVQPGRRVICRGFPAIECGQGLLVLDEVQPAGKKNMPGNSFLQGARNWETAV
jgi:methionyl-tRNA formyltransferase